MAVHTVLLDGPGGGRHGSRGPGPPALRNVLRGKPDRESELPRTRVWGDGVPSSSLRKGDCFSSCPKQDRSEKRDTADQRAVAADANGTTPGGPAANPAPHSSLSPARPCRKHLVVSRNANSDQNFPYSAQFQQFLPPHGPKTFCFVLIKPFLKGNALK